MGGWLGGGQEEDRNGVGGECGGGGGGGEWRGGIGYVEEGVLRAWS